MTNGTLTNLMVGSSQIWFLVFLGSQSACFWLTTKLYRQNLPLGFVLFDLHTIKRELYWEEMKELIPRFVRCGAAYRRQKMTPKIQLFMWRLISDCLPIASSLFHKGLYVNPMCCVCAQQTDRGHLSCVLWLYIQQEGVKAVGS